VKSPTDVTLYTVHVGISEQVISLTVERIIRVWFLSYAYESNYDANYSNPFHSRTRSPHSRPDLRL